MVIGEDAIERIRFYRSSSRSLMYTVLAPLAFGVALSLVMLIVAIGQGRCWLFEDISDYSTALAVIVFIVVVVCLFGIASDLVRLRIRANLKDFYTENKYDALEYRSFTDALEGVSIAAGLNPPPLKVLGIPTVNSIAFREGGKPGVGVTAEALAAGLSRQEKEAMMAHEVAHIVLGDYFLASSSAGFEYAAYGLGVLFLSMAALVTVAINVYVLLFLLPLAVPLAVVRVDARLRKKTRILYRHNDLLADTIAAKLTSDPQSLRHTIEKLWTLSEKTRARIPATAHFQGYMFVTRPLEAGPVKMVTYDGAAATGDKTDTTKIYWVPGKAAESRTWFAFETVEKRAANLHSIERGQWTELEKPNQREKAVNIARQAAVTIIMVLVIVALLIPWHGKTVWDYATTNVVWRMIKS